MPEGLGDKIITLKLDAEPFRAEMAEAAQVSAAQIGKIRSGFDSVQRAQLATARSSRELQHAASALGSSLHLVGGESAFVAAEALRTAAHVGRLTSQAGSLSAAVIAAGSAFRAFLASIGPVGWIIGAAGAAYMVLSRASHSASKENEVFVATQKKVNDQLEVFSKLAEKTRRDTAVARGDLAPGAARLKELQEQFPELKDVRDKSLQEQIRVLSTLPGIGGREFGQVRTALELQVDSEAELARTKEQNAARERIQALRLETSILMGQGTQYDLIADEAERVATMERDRVRTLGDLVAKRRELIAGAVDASGGSAFGIGTRSSSEFRFGFKSGDIIGQQSEQKTTNRLLDKAISKLDVLIMEARKAVGETNPSTANDAFGGGVW